VTYHYSHIHSAKQITSKFNCTTILNYSVLLSVCLSVSHWDDLVIVIHIIIMTGFIDSVTNPLQTLIL